MYGSASPSLGIPGNQRNMIGTVEIADQGGADAISKHERQCREMVEEDLRLAQPFMMEDINIMEDVRLRDATPVTSPSMEEEGGGQVRSSSVFEEAQRPPWFGFRIECTGYG